MNDAERGRYPRQPSTSEFYSSTSNEMSNSSSRLADGMNDFATPSNDSVSGTLANQSFSFLYRRESDKIGAMHTQERRNTSSQLASDQARRRAKTSAMVAQFNEDSMRESLKAPVSDNQMLSTYSHGSKTQDPRFTTSSNEYGEDLNTQASDLSQ